MTTRIFLRYSLIFAGFLALTACAGTEDKDDKPAESVETLYNRAYGNLDEGAYKEAIENFEEVERQHPYSEWSPRAQVMAAYSSYKAGDYDGAIATIERYVKLYPSDESAAYAYYLKALCYYEQISDVSRDQKITADAMQALKDVSVRYPNTQYARDAALKLDLTVDHLAGKEMKIGRYYQVREEYLAAINRFKAVVDQYQTTSHVPEALHRLVECYMALGVKDEAQKYAAVLGHNYPGTDWYRYSYALMQGDTAPEKRSSGWKDWIPF